MVETPVAVTRAVLMIPPLFEERKATLHLLATLGRELARDGAMVARCDVSGTGHAPGDIENLLPDAWQAGLRATIDALRGKAPGVPLYLLGVRIGAAWAAQLAREIPDIAGVILVAPVTGARLLKQLAQRSAVNQMITHGRTLLPPGKVAEAIAADRTIDFDGYAISPALYRALETQTLEPCACHSLLIATQNDASNFAATETITLSLPAFWNTVGYVDPAPIIAPVCEWLKRQPAAATACSPCFISCAQHLALASTLGVLHGFCYAPDATPKSKVLFLHGWSGDSTGPHRMFVKLARRLVAEGHLCHTIDFGGRGDSEGEHRAASIVTMTDDARVAFQHLQTFAPDAPTVIVAICSGSKVALSLATEGVDAHLALYSAEPLGTLRNGRAVAWRKLCHATKSYANKLLQPQTWKKIFTGKVQAGGVRSALVSAEKPSDAEIHRETAALKKLRAFTGRILFLFAARDPEAALSSAAYSEFCRANKIPFDLHTLANTGHSFYNLDAEAEVINRTVKFVARVTETARTPAR